MPSTPQRLTNHIALVVDASGSMSSLSQDVIRVFDSELAHLKVRSKELDQETRVSVYLFDTQVKNVVFDMDVMRFESIRPYYKIGGQTALMDAASLSIKDMGKIPELYSDHAFLVYVLTDGEENASRNQTEHGLKHLIDALPDHWTVVAQVPNAGAVHEAKKFGFPQGNIEIWSTTTRGLEDATKSVRSSIDNYMTLRASGVRGTRSFFKTDLAGKSKDIKANLDQLNPDDYSIWSVKTDSVIREFVASRSANGYTPGSAYYELMKPETIQAYKQVVIQNRNNGKVYGGDEARSILSLPSYELRVRPGDHGDWRIFVQSTSVNRKLIGGTQVLVRWR